MTGMLHMRGRQSARLGLLAALLLAAAVHGTDWARADAALAVGRPADVAKQGLAVGWAVDYASTDAAEKEALARCRGFRDAPQATRDLCQVVQVFGNTCLAVALDPEPGTTGIGWGVHRNRDWAEDIAMEKCAETSAPKRRASCRVALIRCDGR
ncbi:MAG TPA: DUF4189 domain-containing protein [Hyphomicrobiaceae bacterium]|jgi:hypothetical protein|nr:DUF4189 domain-containing protein [Hyphomicrobiaceae bacterium]